MRVTIGALSPDFVKGKDTKQPSGRIADAVEFLHNRTEDDVTLDELSHVAGLRRRQTMLRSGFSAIEAAARAGFADQSHMTRHFVGVVGMTPGAYALDCQKNINPHFHSIRFMTGSLSLVAYSPLILREMQSKRKALSWMVLEMPHCPEDLLLSPCGQTWQSLGSLSCGGASYGFVANFPWICQQVDLAIDLR
ncbi:helix-turn-helix domain-containing protein [Agrobacterium vitis]|uniref:helix-turn-helix domain-containing protein n=1 Tax=Agrobacterium vitis TaxID=373 RepID=UPI003D29747E